MILAKLEDFRRLGTFQAVLCNRVEPWAGSWKSGSVPDVALINYEKWVSYIPLFWVAVFSST